MKNESQLPLKEEFFKEVNVMSTAEELPQAERCRACGEVLENCVCCPECGHICPLEQGEDYCPVCSPPKP
ncbi:MAG: hypothetical protein KAS88_02565 [Deltaproteobacteria bacterium]|nr:hypothetical protein [Deltaproteobacteria bacterium]